jgi:crotonobetainyl-CoA:carnitine CoA-transferase CaiB-like acyl-CoA transferase
VSDVYRIEYSQPRGEAETVQPLAGVTVVDFTQYLAGPYCTMLLADLGADVIKVEPVGRGDESRAMAPVVHGESYPGLMPNRNKRSIALDLKAPGGRTIGRELIGRGDVVVENFRPGVATRLGVDYAAARAQNPEVIYCAITGFGSTGPHRDRPGFDIIAQGMAGFLTMTGSPGGGHTRVGIAINDLAAGMTAANAVLAAYITRLRIGRGQFIDVSLLEAGLALTVWEAGAYFGSGERPGPTGTRHRRLAPYQAFRTADGAITIGANNERLWQRLCRDVLRRPDLERDPRYADNAARVEHVDELEADIEAVLRRDSTEHWVTILDAAGVPGGPVLTYDQALAQDQVVARDAVVELQHPVIGPVRQLAPAARMSLTPPTARQAAPLLGQHSREILTELGRTAGQIAELEAAGVIETRHP